MNFWQDGWAFFQNTGNVFTVHPVGSLLACLLAFLGWPLYRFISRLTALAAALILGILFAEVIPLSVSAATPYYRMALILLGSVLFWLLLRRLQKVALFALAFTGALFLATGFPFLDDVWSRFDFRLVSHAMEHADIKSLCLALAVAVTTLLSERLFVIVVSATIGGLVLYCQSGYKIHFVLLSVLGILFQSILFASKKPKPTKSPEKGKKGNQVK